MIVRYVGQKSRYLSARVREHRRDCWLRKDSSVVIASYCIEIENSHPLILTNRRFWLLKIN